MASLPGELNELLKHERGEVEAVKILIQDLERTDPDLAEGARDVLDTSSWSCRGLYHVFVRLGATPTIDIGDLASQISEQPDAKSKLEMLCSSQEEHLRSVERLLNREDLDDASSAFLKDLLQAHEAARRWCVDALAGWQRDI